MRRRKIFLRFFFFAALLILGFLIFLWGTIFGNIWDGERRFSFIVDTSSSIILLSVSPGERSVTIVNIDPDTYLVVPYGFGTYKVSSIYDLGSLGDEKKKGGILLSRSIQEAFGVPVEGYIRYNTEELELRLSSFSDWSKFSRSYFGFIPMISSIKRIIFRDGNIDTDLQPVEIFKLFGILSGQNLKEVNIYDLRKYEVVIPYKLPDKSRVFKIDSNRLDKVFEGVFQEDRILREGVTVGVFNASRSSGVATIVSRIVSSMGVAVVSVANAKELVPEICFLRGHDNAINSYTAKRIIDLFGCRSSLVSKGEELSGPFELEFLIGEGYDD